jgi:peptidoglycan/xylan/chitin deacetylase (PgdA/CDA1 family)
LTFHGAGETALARQLLTEVERAGAHVTILAVGSWLTAEPAMARRILDGGHELGNHTFHHLPMRTLSSARAFEEIATCAATLHRLTGSSGRWFRPSGTPSATNTILRAAAKAGYSTSLAYDVDPRDYTDPGASAVVSRTLAAVQRGSIVSLHLGHRGTVDALPALLDGLHKRGLRAVTTSALLA